MSVSSRPSRTLSAALGILRLESARQIRRAGGAPVATSVLAIGALQDRLDPRRAVGPADGRARCAACGPGSAGRAPPRQTSAARPCAAPFEPSRITSRLRSVRRPRLCRFAEQALTHGAVFRRAVPEAQRVFLPVAVDAQGHDEAVLADVHAVDQQAPRGRARRAASTCHASSWAWPSSRRSGGSPRSCSCRGCGTPAGAGSRLRAYCRVATPTSICSTTRRSSGSSRAMVWNVGRATSPAAVRTRGRWIDDFAAAEHDLARGRVPARDSPADRARGHTAGRRSRCGPLRASRRRPSGPIAIASSNSSVRVSTRRSTSGRWRSGRIRLGANGTGCARLSLHGGSF